MAPGGEPGPLASPLLASALAVITVLLVGCRSPQTPPALTGPLCYEQLGPRADRPDIEQLRLEPAAERLTGEHRWLPWQKDRRISRLDGRLIAPGTARLSSRTSQEGQVATLALTIRFDAARARIRWQQPAGQEQPVPPPVSLPRRSCAALQPLAGP